MFFFRSVILAAVLSLTTNAFAFGGASDFVFRPAFANFYSDNYKGYDLNANLAFKESPKIGSYVGVAHLKREFNDGSAIDESTYSVGASYNSTKNLYTEFDFALTPQALIAPRSTVSLNPHYASKGYDFGIRFTYSKYVNLEAGIIVPSVYHEFNDQLSAYLASYIVRSEDDLIAFQGKLNFNFYRNNKLSGGAAFGKTLEDAGVEASFKSVDLNYFYNFKNWGVGVGNTKYWSSIRREDSYMLRLEFR